MDDPTLDLALEGWQHRQLRSVVELERQRADGAGNYERRAEMNDLLDLLDSARPDGY